MTIEIIAATDRAIEAAARAFPAWKATSAYDRAKILKKTADLLRERADAIARTLTREQGKPLPEARGEVLHTADTFEWFAEEGKRAYGQMIPNSAPGKRHVTLKHPVGVVAAVGTGLIFLAMLPKLAVGGGHAGSAVYFWIFSAIAIVGALRVVTHPRPVYSALYFVLTRSAGMYPAGRV